MMKKELSIFLIVGGLTVLLDFFIYRGLVWIFLNNVDIAKGTGFIAGTVFAYFANRFWTFGHKKTVAGSLWRFVLLYASTLIVNVGVNTLFLNLLINKSFSIQIAFLFATGCSAVLNFLGMKFLVFTEIRT